MHVIVIEDDTATGQFLVDGFRAAGFQVDHCTDGAAGLELLKKVSCDVCILDLMLPKLDGFGVIKGMRDAQANTPIICLTARDAVDDRIRGLDLGADDYLSKPFSFAELLARVRALLRRGTETLRSKIEIADLRIDLAEQIVLRGKRRIDLSPTEFKLILSLARKEGQVVPRSVLLHEAWGIQYDPMTNIVDVHINRLRRKIDVGTEAPLIHTVRGVGYVLRAAVDA